MKIYTQRVQLDVDNAGGYETTPGTPQFARPNSPFEPEPNTIIHPPVPPAVPSHPGGDTNPEIPPPLPLSDDLDNLDLPAPVPGPIASGRSQDDLQDDQEDPLPDSDEDLTPADYANEDSPPLDPDSDEDPPPPDSDDEDPPPDSEDEQDDPTITLENMKMDLRFIRMVEEATLESQFSATELHALKNPRENHSSPSDDPDLLLSVSFYISSLDHAQSQRGYAEWREIIQERFPESKMLSYDQVKRRVSDISGVITWKHHMCFDSCIGFTGPFKDLEECPRCYQPRYDQDQLRKSDGKKKVPRKVFTTFPLGPQLQARWKSPEMAQKMFYRRDKTQEELGRERDEEYIYDDIFCGSDYLDAVRKGAINDYDTVVMLSIDGAQLYRNKKSDCWIYIWIILDLAPNQRYKIRNILPGGIIPGPEKPKNLDSFLFPGLSHVSAVQKEGLCIWDGYHRRLALSLLFLLLALADAVGMAELSGSVGHHGRKGCRLLCPLIGRNKLGGSHYYPVLLKPFGADNPSSNHPDINIEALPSVDLRKYRQDLNIVLGSQTEAQYRQQRLQTGIKKASIFDGLFRILEPPTCFPGDLMHQPILNLTALMFDLWCDREGCRKGDPTGVWEWAVLKGDVWKAHGKAVADAALYFPRSFDRTPRNPAEKISSGYKAWEFLLYFYGLGPSLFYGIIPPLYYQHYCKLVVGIRIIYQRRISGRQLQLANKFLLEWALEFELLYYQRKPERLHFVRQCVHSLTHLGPETDRLGPPSLSAQWTMERAIGHFGSLIKQPSNPFANLAEQAKKVAEVNAITAMYPELERKKKDPHGSINIGNGSLLLGPKDEKPYRLSSHEHDALVIFYSSLPSAEPIPRQSVYRWARFQIPTGQIARSYWKEVVRSSKLARTDRNLKVHDLMMFTFRFLTYVGVNSVGSISRQYPDCGSEVLLPCYHWWKSGGSRPLLYLFPC